MKYLKAFALFWYDFIVGDDWRVAATIAVALGLTALVVDAGLNVWWFLPVAVVVALAWSLRRATRRPSGYR
jgi:hypothetical protein